MSGCVIFRTVGVVVVMSLVDRWFIRVWSRCPWCMAMESGAYWRTRLDVSSGHVVK